MTGGGVGRHARPNALWRSNGSDGRQVAYDIAALSSQAAALSYDVKDVLPAEVDRVMDVDAILTLRDIHNEYALSDKGRTILKTQRRGFYGFLRDESFRSEYLRRRVRWPCCALLSTCVFCCLCKLRCAWLL
jgi:hypothetical protein